MMLRCWGADADKFSELNPPDEVEPETDALVYWRPSNEIAKMRTQAKGLHLVCVECDTEDAELLKTAVVTLAHDGVMYTIRTPFGYGFEDSTLLFMFEQGNYACDCNLSSFIREIVPSFPPKDCGDTIEVVHIDIEARQRTTQKTRTQ